MEYASAEQFLTRYNPDEIAQRVDQGIPRTLTGQSLLLAARDDIDAIPDDERDPAYAGVALITRVLQDASQTIDAYVGSRYQLPLADVPAVLERIACQLARYGLYDDQSTEQVRNLHDDSIRFLEQIAAGKIQLGLTWGEDAPRQAQSAEIVSAGTVFGRDKGGFL